MSIDRKPEERPKWLFTCYGHEREGQNDVEGDISPEEVCTDMNTHICYACYECHDACPGSYEGCRSGCDERRVVCYERESGRWRLGSGGSEWWERCVE